jgi:hypothetical protein
MTTNNHDKGNPDKGNRNSKSQELTPEDLHQVVGGGAPKWSHDDEAPKETVTFEYGALVVQYHQQMPDGAVSTK